MKTIFLALALLMGLPGLAACKEQTQAAASQQQAFELPVEPLHILSDAGVLHKLTAETADTPEAIMKGLMFRESMPPDHGMLFVFPQESERNFWMKNTLIPLDIIFIRADGIINHIHENAIPHDETPVPSNGRVLHVLELNGGTAARLGLKAGDRVEHRVFGKKLAQ